MELGFVLLSYLPIKEVAKIVTTAQLTEDEVQGFYSLISGNKCNDSVKLTIMQKLSQNEPINVARECMSNMRYIPKEPSV